ncbi:hypothetical protein AURDEDRAFT_112551 [Auricularia subglabra TFB-10046 SS5]|nr:hypothetical protein AURDEDRAFT_112551 [Auricularia subglabra TFB-10046 SS5]
MPFPGISRRITTLRELQCSVFADTDSRRIFKLCPSLERLLLDCGGHQITASQLPQGPPPDTLKQFSLSAWRGLPHLTQYFQPWSGHRGLETVTLTGLREGASPAALFASICVGLWTMRIRRSSHSPVNVMFGANDAAFPQCQASIPSDVDCLLAWVPYSSKLVVLDVPAFVLVSLAREGNLTLPAVKMIKISKPYNQQSDEYDSDDGYEDDDSSVPELFEMAQVPSSVIRAPALESITFGVGGAFIEDMMAFTIALRSTIDFASDRLQRITFSHVHEDDLAEMDTDGAITQGLRGIAQEIYCEAPFPRVQPGGLVYSDFYSD